MGARQSALSDDPGAGARLEQNRSAWSAATGFSTMFSDPGPGGILSPTVTIYRLPEAPFDESVQ